eukprot:jgi/Chlat1/2828/Chrsp187S08767
MAYSRTTPTASNGSIIEGNCSRSQFNLLVLILLVVGGLSINYRLTANNHGDRLVAPAQPVLLPGSVLYQDETNKWLKLDYDGPAPSTINATAIVDARPQKLVFTLLVITCNRPASLQRLLTSLSKADYLGDIVDLRILVDRCTKVKKDHDEVKKLAAEFEWPHGVKTIVFRQRNVGLKLSWLESFYPPDEYSVPVIFEDDLEVSPYFYRFMRLATYRYYLLEFDPHNVGLCLNAFGFPSMRHPFYKNRMVCSWGAVMFPHTWRGFLDWSDEQLSNSTYEPHLPLNYKMTFFAPVKPNTWTKEKWPVWTPLFFRFMYEKDLYTVFYAFDNDPHSFALNHQEAGANIRRTRGPNDWDAVDKPDDKYFAEPPPLADLELRLDLRCYRTPIIYTQ